VAATRVLLTGAAGLLGGRLALRLGRDHAVTAAVHEQEAPPGLPSVALDLALPESVRRAVETCRPDAVVHAGALADANRCEREPERARAVNVLGTRAVAEACRENGLRLVALSTDLVFDGASSRRGEEDEARPVLLYGRTKLDGEEEALRRCAGSAVVRVALVYGLGHGPRPTASEAVAWALRRSERPRLFTDQFRTPVDADAVADAVSALLLGQGSGRFHLGGPERVSRFELGQRVAAVLGLDPSPIQAVSQAEVAFGAPRPADVSLDSSRARRELGFAPVPLEVGIRTGRAGRPD
jgi:dTDP-4-dehydrorhamnose reductase